MKFAVNYLEWVPKPTMTQATGKESERRVRQNQTFHWYSFHAVFAVLAMLIAPPRWARIVNAAGITTVHIFSGNDGSNLCGMMQGSDGNFYGTTTYGGPMATAQSFSSDGNFYGRPTVTALRVWERYSRLRPAALSRHSIPLTVATAQVRTPS